MTSGPDMGDVMKRFICILLLLTHSVLGSSAGWCGFQAGNDNTTIHDVRKWHHPVKRVLARYQILLNKVELRNRTYAVFYVTLRFDPLSSQNDSYYNRLYLDLLKANQWSDYSLDAASDNLIIRITWDKGSRTMHKEFVAK